MQATKQSPPAPIELNDSLARRVQMNRQVDAISLVEEYVGRANGRAFGMQLIKTGLPMLISDLIALTVCFWIGIGLTAGITSGAPANFGQYYFILTAGIFVTFLVNGLYSGGGMHPVYEFRQSAISTTLVFILVAAAMSSFSSPLPTLLTFPLMLAAVPLLRNAIRNNLKEYNWWGVRCIVFNCDRRVNRLFKQHLKNRVGGLKPIGFIQSELDENVDPEIAAYHLGDIKDAYDAMSIHQAYCAVVHRCGRPDHEIFDFVSKRLKHFSRILIVPDDHRLPSLWSLGNAGGICLQDKLFIPSSQFTKRTMDVVCSLAGLLILAPLFFAIAVWTQITAPGPLFFGHERVGKHGRRFKAWKFRTMMVNSKEILEKTLAENPELRKEWEETYKLKNDPRITAPGKFLRKTSLDELPQLWNVLKGEMSLVGPRPIVIDEVDRYSETFQNYLRVTPGITGFWQVSGRNLTSYDRRVELDDYYVQNWSIWFDLYILCRTVKTVFMREGAY